MILIQIFLNLLLVYFVIGFFFGLYVLISGGAKIDPILKNNTWKLRLLLFCGLLATWPFLIKRMFKSVHS